MVPSQSDDDIVVGQGIRVARLLGEADKIVYVVIVDSRHREHELSRLA